MNRQGDSPLVRIGVIGIGGAGGNAVNRMMQERRTASSSVFNSVLIMAANTDAQDLDKSEAEQKIQLGPVRTKGLGAGADPQVGREAAEESRVEIANNLSGLDMLFITAGMGGGTGTGAAPVVAEAARSAGVLTVAVVTTPFLFEKKTRIAQEGLEALRAQVDTLVVIPNEKLVSLAEDHDYDEMFRRCDEVLINAVRSLADLVTHQATIHADFADVRATMTGVGSALIAIGAAAGENAPLNAVREALGNPLLSDVTIKGARRLLLHFDGMRMPMRELEAAGRFISDQLHQDAKIIWGIGQDKTADKIRVLIVSEAMPVVSAPGRPGAMGFQNTVPRGVTQESQVSLFDVASAKTVPAVQEEASPERAAPAEEKPHREEAAPAAAPSLAPAAEAKGQFRDRMTQVDLNEKVLFHLPDDMDADPDDPNVPAVIRQQMKRQAAADHRASAVRKEAAPKKGDERQSEFFAVHANGKNGRGQQ